MYVSVTNTILFLFKEDYIVYMVTFLPVNVMTHFGTRTGRILIVFFRPVYTYMNLGKN